MPDLGIAAQINAPNMATGIGNMSAILGLQQQRQALTQQALDIQRSQIETEAQTGANNFFKNWDPGQHHGADGTLDLDSAHESPQYQALSGAARLKVEAAMNTIRGQQLTNKAALATIDANAVGRLAQVAQAAKNDPTYAPQLFDSFAQQNPENARAAAIYRPWLEKGGWQPGALAATAAQATDVVSQQPTLRPVQTAQGTQLTTFTPQTSAVAPAGFIKRGVGPTETPEFQEQVAAATATGTEAARRAAGSQEAANRSPQILNALTEARSLIESDPSILRGPMTPKLQGVRSALAGVFGLDMNTAANGNMLAKQLAFAGMQRAHELGAGGSDAGRDMTVHASPNTVGDAKSLPKLITQAMGLEQYNLGVANARTKVGADPIKQQEVESKARSVPHAVEAYEYGLARTPAEANDILKRYNVTPAQMKQSRETLRKLGALQ